MLAHRSCTVPRSGSIGRNFFKRTDIKYIVIYCFRWQLADIKIKEIYWALESDIRTGINWYGLVLDTELLERPIPIL